jgi:KRAB domain-containing zinc finger protein
MQLGSQSCTLCEVCGEIIPEDISLPHSHKTSSVYCSKCGFIGCTQALKTHKALIHDKSIKTFQDAFTAFVRIEDRQLDDTIERSFECKKCGKLYCLKSSLRRHIREHYFDNKNKEFTCDICDKIYNSPHKLTRHQQQKHVKIGLYKCRVCNKTYQSEKSLQAHRRRFHGIYVYIPQRRIRE